MIIKKRLAFITSGLYPFETHGAEVGVYYLAQALVRHGFAVTIYLSEPIRKQFSVEQPQSPKGMKIVLTPGVSIPLIYNLSFIVRTLARLSKKERRPAVIAVNIPTLLSLLTAWMARYILQIPYVVIVHGPPDIERSRNPLRLLQCEMMGSASRIICVSRDLSSRLEEVCGFSQESIDVIPNGYDEREIEEVHRQVKSADFTPRVVFVGALDENKDPVSLVRAFGIVLQSISSASLFIVGEGELEQDVRREILAAGLRSASFSPFMPHRELLSVLAGGTMLAVTSRSEGTPTVVVEALALGRPVVAMAVGGLPEIIKNGRNGFLVPPGDVQAFAKRMIDILGDKGLWESLSTEAARSVAGLTWVQLAQRYATILNSLTERNNSVSLHIRSKKAEL